MMIALLRDVDRTVPIISERYTGKIEGKMNNSTRKDEDRFNKKWRESCSVHSASVHSISGMIQAHYLHKRPAIITCCLAMYHGLFVVGMVIFAMPPRELNKRYGGTTWELARLWIDDSVPRNCETWLISKSVKYVQNYHKEVMFLVSYADPSVGHQGTIYKAANWCFDGMTDEGRKTPRCDYRDIISGKKYSRKSHVPDNAKVSREPRVSKFRYKLQIRKRAE